MNRLGIDTSTAACSVAVLRADGFLFERSPDPARMFNQPAHTTELLPAVIDLLDEAGLGFDELGAIAVGVGPGAFTGLRIGLATARAIATARGIPVTPVSSLATLAVKAGQDEPLRVVLPILDARRGEFYFGSYRGGPAQECLRDDSVGPPAEVIGLAERLVGDGLDPIAVGEGAIALADDLRETGAEVTPEHDLRHVVHAASLLELAEQLEPVLLHEVVPNYIRPPDAKVSARERWLVGAES